MLSVMCGVPGCGKSYYAVSSALKHIAGGGAVVTNIRFSGVVENDKCADGDYLHRFLLSASSPVRDVLRRDFSWDYRDGQYIFVDLATMDSGFLCAVPKGSPN